MAKVQILDRTFLDTKCRHRQLSDIVRLVIHRTNVADTGEGTAQWFAANKKYTGGKPPYHLVITDNGECHQIVRLSRVAPGALTANPDSIQIAVHGDFREHPPTVRQCLALVEVCVDLCAWMGRLDVFGHDEIPGASTDPNKQCPGEHLHMQGLRDYVKNYIETGDKDLVAKGWKL